MAKNTGIIFLWPVGTKDEEAVKFGILRSVQNQVMFHGNKSLWIVTPEQKLLELLALS